MNPLSGQTSQVRLIGLWQDIHSVGGRQVNKFYCKPVLVIAVVNFASGTGHSDHHHGPLYTRGGGGG